MDQLLFEELDLSKEMKKAIEDIGFEEATPIQSLTIPHALAGEDVIGQAQTGTGKTAAFGIPVLEKVYVPDNSVQAIVLCPTRELCIQVAEEIVKLSKYMKKVKVLPIYGGQPIGRQIRALNKGVHIVIGTPGRVMDHLQRGTLKLDGVEMVVLDEADEMLDMGFREDIEEILRFVPKKRQTLLFSATLSKDILRLTKKYQKNPQFLKVPHHHLSAPKIDQSYFEVNEKMKAELLSRLMDIHDIKLALVFCNTKRRVDRLVKDLKTRGYFVDGIHGDMRQAQRDRVMNKYRNGKIDILVATDVAARGIDVPDVEAVFNHDVPNDTEYYVHRIGRTGRAGKQGRSFTFVSGKEIYKLRDIQRYTKTKIKQERIPSLGDIEKIKIDLLLEKVKNSIQNDNLDSYIHTVEGLIEIGFNSLDISAALLKIIKEKEL
ncbi:DEAD/DEAH box helicase [Methanobacterium alkalithermotolerans]|uniref:DEAD/DEAH box helicase n=1 Tax=Methanobacterium alkalithermotolerans TaxID=2731220 RepID=A0A8T8KB95_9EURY|nr:DEAD/DEAH box helicase [Methanobacterium alkalithermotolerans]QUH24070.1 DEAD/DEAH box helicase [Methanobacterium alkalithermotolerans]RJS48995.1 MAG: ATP-dependent RNA helicase [Methanobacterium sp.]